MCDNTEEHIERGGIAKRGIIRRIGNGEPVNIWTGPMAMDWYYKQPVTRGNDVDKGGRLNGPWFRIMCGIPLYLKVSISIVI